MKCESDSCHYAGLPWVLRVGEVVKRTVLARVPHVLCVQLKRATFTQLGQQVKIAGHVTFPSTLDLLPFTCTAVGALSERFSSASLLDQVGRSPVWLVQGAAHAADFEHNTQQQRQQGHCEQLDSGRQQQAGVQQNQAEMSDNRTLHQQQQQQQQHEQIHGARTAMRQAYVQDGVKTPQAVSSSDSSEHAVTTNKCGTATQHHDEWKQRLTQPGYDHPQVPDQLLDDAQQEHAPPVAACEVPQATSCAVTDSVLHEVGRTQDSPEVHRRYSSCGKRNVCQSQYTLCAVIVHHGGLSADSGHYTVYRRLSLTHDTDKVSWVNISDRHVHATTIRAALDSEATMLLYERQQ